MLLRIHTWCLAAALALGALCSAGTSAAAQETYPNQNVRFVVAFPPGGPTDVVGRLLGQRLNEKWGQGVVVENRGEHIKAGKLKALAVISDKRIPSLPEVPTALEQGFGDGEEATWIALFAPAATPVPVLTKLNADLNAVLAEAPIRERFEQIGVLPVGGTLAKSEAYVHAEIKKWGEVVRKIGLRID